MSSEGIKIDIPDIQASRIHSQDLPQEIADATEPQTENPPVNINTTIIQTSDLLKNIDIIKDELCKLPLDPCELEYITIKVNPLMNIIYELANATSNLAASVTYLQNSPIVHPKKSELKDTIHLMYDLNEECEDVFKELKRRINKVLED